MMEKATLLGADDEEMNADKKDIENAPFNEEKQPSRHLLAS